MQKCLTVNIYSPGEGVVVLALSVIKTCYLRTGIWMKFTPQTEISETIRTLHVGLADILESDIKFQKAQSKEGPAGIFLYRSQQTKNQEFRIHGLPRNCMPALESPKDTTRVRRSTDQHM